MGKLHPMALRERVVAFVDEGHSHRAAARTYDELWRAVGQVCDLFTEEKCANFFTAAEYEGD